jgi:hypothetical protein
VRRGAGARCLTLERSDVGSIDNRGSFGVVRSHWAIVDQVVSVDGLELSFVGAPNLAIQFVGGVCGKNFATGEQFLMLGDGGHHGVRGDMVVSSVITVKHVYLRKRITVPSSRWTFIEGSANESIVMRQTLRTSASDRMFAIYSRLYHTLPRFGKSPTMLES